jgi:UDP-N-acetylglucosamine diphosphorylase/glucosamine-1-phosphate N-acetyltransferase
VIIILFDTPVSRANLYPFSITRSLSGLFFGCLTIKQRWEKLTGAQVFSLSTPLLTDEIPQSASYLCVDATVVPDETCLNQMLGLQVNEQVEDEIGLIAYKTTTPPIYGQLPVWPGKVKIVVLQQRLQHPTTIISHNAQFIRVDASLRAQKMNTGHPPSNSNTLIGSGLYLEEAVAMEACTINTMEGEVIIASGALVMEGTQIRGPVYIGEGAVVKMGSKIYGGTSIGAGCTVGGEIKNSIMLPFSNKAHDGYLGDSMLGSWCNLGAGTNNSNVKNSAGQVSIWHQGLRQMISAGNKCGLLMGDYSRCAVNTRFNTGTTTGICCSIQDEGIPPKHLPSFSWGIAELYRTDKVLEHIANWKKLKQQELGEKEAAIIRQAYSDYAPKFEA